MTTQCEDRLQQTLGEVLDVPPGAISDESSPATISSWDSVNHLNLVLALESEYEVSLSPDDVLAMRNVGLIRSLLRGYGVEL